MTPNKLPPLPKRKDGKPGIDRLWDTQWMNIVNHADCWRTFTKEDAVAQAVLMTEKKMAENFAEALRQSQSLPAGAVAGLVGKWRDSSSFETDGYSILHRCATELEQAIQADAREKGEAVVRLYPEELARMTHGPSLRLDEEDRLRSIYGDIAIPLYLHSGDYTEAMLLLEKQRELVENLRGQLDDAKADATDGCTEANCERCNTAIHSRGDMRHAGIGTYPATQPAQASEAAAIVESDGTDSSWRITALRGMKPGTKLYAIATSSQETASE